MKGTAESSHGLAHPELQCVLAPGQHHRHMLELRRCTRQDMRVCTTSMYFIGLLQLFGQCVQTVCPACCQDQFAPCFSKSPCAGLSNARACTCCDNTILRLACTMALACRRFVCVHILCLNQNEGCGMCRLFQLHSGAEQGTICTAQVGMPSEGCRRKPECIRIEYTQASHDRERNSESAYR